MEWAENLSVGVDAIDNQHKELIKRVNVFYAALKAGNNKDETLKVLDFLSRYVVSHFRDEEALQVKYKYPKYNEHKKLHKDFLETVVGVKKDIETNGVTSAGSTMIAMTVSNWLVNHIGVQDKEIGKFIKANC
jgi:hemerythrin